MTVRDLWQEHPVLVQGMGLCPAVVVTDSAGKALALGLAAGLVLLGASLPVALVGERIPVLLRHPVYLLIVVILVTAADYALQALVPVIHQELWIFVPLLAVNCMILIRLQACAADRGIGPAITAAGGFLAALVLLGSIREVLGSGSLFGLPLFGSWFQPWQMMLVPGGGFITLGLLLLWYARRRDKSS